MRSSVFEKNMQALETRYPELFRQVCTTGAAGPATIVRTGAADAAVNLLSPDDRGGCLWYDNEDPLGYCRRYIRSLDLGYAPVVIFLGFGLGYQVQSALQDFSQQLCIQHIVIIEKDLTVFRAALQYHDFSRIITHPAIHLFVGCSASELFFALRTHFVNHPSVLEYARNLKFIALPALHRFEPSYYGEAYRCVKDATLHILQHMGNDPYDALLGIRQTVANLRPLIEDPGIAAFRGCFRAKPGIVIGAGPSLNKNIHLLREAADKAVLIAVDAALKPLLNAGVRPHLVTNIERTAGVNAFFLNLGRQEEIFFVFSPVAAPGTYAAFDGPKIIAHRYEKLMQWLALPKGALTGGPLVCNFAFDMAQYLGCDPIILVGQDLSFTPSGATHASGNVFGQIDEYKRDTREVEGNYQERLLTTPSFEEGRKSLEVQVRHYPGVCINATEGGARINGCRFVSLRRSIDAYCRVGVDAVSILKRIWTAEKSCQQDVSGELRRAGALIDQSLAEMDAALDDCRRGLDMIDAFLRSNPLTSGDGPDPNVAAAIRALTGELNEIRGRVIALPSFAVFEMVIQGYHFDLEMRRNMAHEQFRRREFAESKSFLLLKEWFATVGQLILSTRFAIERARSAAMAEAGCA